MSLPPIIVASHLGALCRQDIRRSVQSWGESVFGMETWAGRWHTMPVSGSICRDNVSTAMTCVDLSFQGQYLRQLAVDTSSQE